MVLLVKSWPQGILLKQKRFSVNLSKDLPKTELPSLLEVPKSALM